MSFVAMKNLSSNASSVYTALNTLMNDAHRRGRHPAGFSLAQIAIAAVLSLDDTKAALADLKNQDLAKCFELVCWSAKSIPGSAHRTYVDAFNALANAGYPKSGPLAKAEKAALKAWRASV